MPRTVADRRARIVALSAGLALTAGIIVGSLAMGEDRADADSPVTASKANASHKSEGDTNPMPWPVTPHKIHNEHSGRIADHANTSLDRAMNEIAQSVEDECDKSAEACRSALDSVKQLGLTWGGDSNPIVFHKDGTWEIGTKDDKR